MPNKFFSPRLLFLIANFSVNIKKKFVPQKRTHTCAHTDEFAV